MKKLVFDVGGTAIKYALMDNEAVIYEKGKEPTPHDNFEHFLEILKSIYERYAKEIDGIALSVPGTVDSEKGMIYAPGGIAYNENVNLVDRIHTFTDLPVSIENDGKSAALAEAWKGNLKDCSEGIVIVLGTGIGGGIIKDKKVWKGKHLFAGEFSYMFQEEGNSFKDVWAMKGSTTALLMDVAKRKEIEINQLDGYKVFDMIHKGDVDACEALQGLAKNLARGIYNLQCILDPQKILIGGGISKQSIIIEKIQEELDKLYEMIPFEIPHACIDNCCFYNDSNLIGALYNFFIMHEQRLI